MCGSNLDLWSKGAGICYCFITPMEWRKNTRLDILFERGDVHERENKLNCRIPREDGVILKLVQNFSAVHLQAIIVSRRLFIRMRLWVI